MKVRQRTLRVLMFRVGTLKPGASNVPIPNIGFFNIPNENIEKFGQSETAT
jgi:hypothetical protein